MNNFYQSNVYKLFFPEYYAQINQVVTWPAYNFLDSPMYKSICESQAIMAKICHPISISATSIPAQAVQASFIALPAMNVASILRNISDVQNVQKDSLQESSDVVYQKLSSEDKAIWNDLLQKAHTASSKYLEHTVSINMACAVADYLNEDSFFMLVKAILDFIAQCVYLSSQNKPSK